MVAGCLCSGPCSLGPYCSSTTLNVGSWSSRHPQPLRIIFTELESVPALLSSSCISWSWHVIGKAIQGGRGSRNLVEGWKAVASRNPLWRKKDEWGGKDNRAASVRTHSKEILNHCADKTKKSLDQPCEHTQERFPLLKLTERYRNSN